MRKGTGTGSEMGWSPMVPEGTEGDRSDGEEDEMEDDALDAAGDADGEDAVMSAGSVWERGQRPQLRVTTTGGVRERDGSQTRTATDGGASVTGTKEYDGPVDVVSKGMISEEDARSLYAL